MQKHAHFDLRLHDERELQTLLGESIVERVTLHEWPLSCVQQLTLTSGRTLIYKTQFGPTCEPAFYATARSPLLVQAQTIYRQGAYVCMVLAKAPGSPLGTDILTEEQAVALGHQLIGQIQQIEGDLPVHLDLSSELRWRQYVQSVQQTLQRLIAAAQFSQTSAAAVMHLTQTAQSPTIIEALLTDVGYVHGDLMAANIMVDASAAPPHHYVLDWQRPLRGPTGLDLYRFLSALGHEPQFYGSPGMQTLDQILHIGWLTECAARWFQPGVSGYDGQIAQLIEELEA